SLHRHFSCTPFVSKLFNLLTNDAYHHIISWDKDGTTVIVHDQEAFAKNILPVVYTHSNLTSFVRQLHKYGFRKSSGEFLTFSHPRFLKGRVDLLPSLRRR
ncbi:winged helix DNA-binding domain-containing protein, partial [Ramicandelaber brevisporus]